MLDYKRFIKFKFEKQSDKIKLKDNDINILFYSEKNILLSDNFNSQKNLLTLFKKIIINESSDIILIRSEKGNFLLVKRKTLNKDLTCKYLEELGGKIYNKIKPLGASQAKIFENDVIEPVDMYGTIPERTIINQPSMTIKYASLLCIFLSLFFENSIINHPVTTTTKEEKNISLKTPSWVK